MPGQVRKFNFITIHIMKGYVWKNKHSGPDVYSWNTQHKSQLDESVVVRLQFAWNERLMLITQSVNVPAY